MGFLFSSSEEKEAKRKEEEQLRMEVASRNRAIADEESRRDKERKELREKIQELTRENTDAVEQARKLLELVKPEISAYAAEVAPKWEYLGGSDIESEKLDELGENGWELISLTSYETGYAGSMTVHMRYIFKRPVPKEFPEHINKKFKPFTELINRAKELKTEIEDLESHLASI